MKETGRIVSALFNEDLDVNTAAGQLAAALGQVGGLSLEGADTIVFPKVDGMSILGITTIHEVLTNPDGGGYLHFPGLMGDRKIRVGEVNPIGDVPYTKLTFPPGQFPIPPGQKMKAVAQQIGAAAEQHSIIVDFWHPGLADVPMIGNGPCPRGVIQVGCMTGALVAATISGLTSVLGDVVAFQDSEIELPTTNKSQYALLKFGAYPALVNVNIGGVRMPDGLSDRLWPAVVGSQNTGKDHEFGLLFTGDAPPKLVGCGAVTTSTEFFMTIGLIS